MNKEPDLVDLEEDWVKSGVKSPEDIKYNQIEYRIQVAAVEHIRTAFPHLLFTHCPNRPANGSDGFFKKKMGVRPGVADLLFWWKGGFGAIELKAPGASWSRQQNMFAGIFVAKGGHHAVCSSVEALHNTLVGWGHIPATTSIKEPDLRSDSQKKKDAYEMYRP